MPMSLLAAGTRRHFLAILLPLLVPWSRIAAQSSVTPHGTLVRLAPSTSDNGVVFTVKNTVFTTETFSVSCLTDQYTPTCSSSPSTVGPLSHNQTANVTVTYSTGTSGSGLLTLDATGNTTHT